MNRRLAPSRKLTVSLNLAISLDGKIATAAREHFYLGSPEDRREMNRIRRRHDAVLVGAQTLRGFKKYSGIKGAKAPQPWNIILSRSLEGVDPAWPFFTYKGGRRLLVVTQAPPTERLVAFQKTSEVLVIPDLDRSGLALLFAALRERGIQRLLVEGGGEIVWTFARFNLIDRYHVTLTPWIVGGKDAPSLVQGIGFSNEDLLRLKLLRARRKGQEIFLEYGKKKAQ